MRQKQNPTYAIVPWTQDYDASEFSSDLTSIKKYIQEHAHRDVSSHTSAVFVLLETATNKIRGYYSLSSISVVFDGLPPVMQKKLPRYPETSGVLLGRLGVDKNFSIKCSAALGEKARLGELLLVDAQARALSNAKKQGSAVMVVDAEMPRPEELAAGARDPLPFYTQYGFVPLTTSPRRVVKTMRQIEKEFGMV